MIKKKVKDIGIGKYPTIIQLNKYRRACLLNENDKQELYYYFKIKGKIKRKKLF